jgi:hypothetical protein
MVSRMDVRELIPDVLVLQVEGGKDTVSLFCWV